MPAEARRRQVRAKARWACPPKLADNGGERRWMQACASGADKEGQRLGKSILYYSGRFLQVIGMWILLVDLFTAGPLGPNAKLFAVGVGIFLAGWAATTAVKRT